MSYRNAWKSGTAILLTLGLTTGSIAPALLSTPAVAQGTARTSFPDVPSTYWAAPFIQELTARGIIAGFPEDGTFRPEEPVTRAQFAAMVRRAFNRPPIRNPIQFVDVPANYWAKSAIDEAYTTGFMAGYPGNVFRPDENIPRAQILVSISSGLNYTNSVSVDQILQVFNDASAIPSYARTGVAAATEKQVVVNYPDLRTLNPNRAATRAEVAAFIYQALVSLGQAPAVQSPYIVGQQNVPGIRIPAGATIPVRYTGAQAIALPKNGTESVPVTLEVAQNVVTSQGVVLIPAGSRVTGTFRNVQGGAQFTAQELQLPNARTLPMSAESEVINNYTVVRRDNATGRIIAGTLVGAGAGAGVAAVTGDRQIQAWEVLTGAAAGALAGTFLSGRAEEVIALAPNTNLLLTLTSDLVLREAQPR